MLVMRSRSALASSSAPSAALHLPCPRRGAHVCAADLPGTLSASPGFEACVSYGWLRVRDSRPVWLTRRKRLFMCLASMANALLELSRA